MGGPGPAGKHPGKGSNINHPGFFRRVVENLLMGPAGQKARKGMNHRSFAPQGHAPRHGNHILLGDAAFEITSGKALLESENSRVLGQVRIKNDKVRIFGGQRKQSPPVGGNQALLPFRGRGRMERKRLKGTVLQAKTTQAAIEPRQDLL